MKKLTVILTILAFAVLLTYSVSAYSDVSGDEWYAEAANELYSKKLMVGSAENTFMPKRPITRAEACCVIKNALTGAVAQDGEYKSVFTDCERDDWFTPYVMWCSNQGIVTGWNNTFRPNDTLRREQLAVMLKKACDKYSVNNKCPTVLSLANYTDIDTASDWAVASLEWAVRQGYFTGIGNNELAPWKYVSRAEFAVIIRNLLSVMKNGVLPPDNSGEDEYSVAESNKTRIVCWGDSLTQGVNVTAFPRVLQNKLGVRCVNNGVGGETAELIAMRQGALSCYVMPVEIPAEECDVAITFCNEKGRRVDLSYFGVSGLSTVVIDGIEGNVYYSVEKNTAIFHRLESGEGAVLNRLTRVITKGMRDRSTGDIGVYFIGSNNGFGMDDAEYFASLIDSMISYSGSEKYVVIGLTSKSYTRDVAEINSYLSEHFGENFLDIRTYFLTDALSDAKITPTAQDIIDISNGEIPSSLRVDGVHGNQIFNNLLAQKLEEKISSLGYINR